MQRLKQIQHCKKQKTEHVPHLKIGLSLVLFLLTLHAKSQAAVLKVPMQYPTIQTAIDNSNDADTVLVAPGTYNGEGNRDIDFRGKTITVRSENGPQTCIIDCQGSLEEPHRGFNFLNSEGTGSILDGYTIINGYADGGGGIRCEGSSPTIRNCIINDNVSNSNRDGSNGGGIFCSNSNAIISNCTINDNTAVVWAGIVIKNGEGSAIYCDQGNTNIENCVINGNIGISAIACSNGNLKISDCSVSDSNSITHGYRIICSIYSLQSELIVNNCIVTNNVGSGIRTNQGTLMISDSTIGNNSAYSGGGIFCNGNLTITSSVISENESEEYGGGLLCKEGTWIIKDCIIVANKAYDGGGGIYCDDGTLILTDSKISGNVNLHPGSDRGIFYFGGGILCNEIKARFNNCSITRNYSDSGGGIGSLSCPDVTIDSCIISGNISVRDGGGMWSGSSPTLTNCIFSGNYAKRGGGFYGRGTLTNCTFCGNWAESGRGILNFYPDLQLKNCILWDGGNEIASDDSSVIKISYSDMRGGWPGEGNIDIDPLFANPGYWADADDPNIAIEPNDPNAVWVDGDYHLKSQAGRWDPVGESWIVDDVRSPCIDAGDPNSPIGYEPFPNGGIINMGAYGGTAEASKSYFGKPVCETIIAGDINGDCKVDFDDLMILMAHWLQDCTPQD